VDLIADVGNTRAHVALFEGERLVARVDVPHSDPPKERAAALSALLAPADPSALRFALCSVNAPGRDRLVAWSEEVLGRAPRVLRADLPDPLPLLVDEPSAVGADRVANAWWAARTHPGEAVVVVDLGTAITYNVVSPAGAFLGGAIAAGLMTSARALAGDTDQLPQVQLAAGDTPTAVGKTTRDCLQGGLLWAAVGAIEATCRRIGAELGQGPRVVLTGGDAALVAPHLTQLGDHVPDVTLRGVRLALEASP
jgi:type III pantothenate kinase